MSKCVFHWCTHLLFHTFHWSWHLFVTDINLLLVKLISLHISHCMESEIIFFVFYQILSIQAGVVELHEICVSCQAFIFHVMKHFWSEQGLVFLSTTASRLVLGPTKPPIQWVLGVLFLAVKQPGLEADHSHPCSAKVNNVWSCTSTPPVHLHNVHCLAWTTLPNYSW
jgi:hypothetical protein